MTTLQMQTLGNPFFDPHAIQLAFDEKTPVGYVHTTLGPTSDGSDLSTETGQICFLCVDPEYHDLWGAGRALLFFAEEYLRNQGVREIYGGSPRPCAPFYIGFFGGAEPIGFFNSDPHLIQVFQESKYEILQTTKRYRLGLAHYVPQMRPSTLKWRAELTIKFGSSPKPKTWWEACAFANFEWIEVLAMLKSTGKPVCRIRVRVANPDAEEDDVLYGGTWDAALMDMRVHPDFVRRGVGAFTLGEMLRYLIHHSQAMQIEAHLLDNDSSMNQLLHYLNWEVIDTGMIFRKQF